MSVVPGVCRPGVDYSGTPATPAVTVSDNADGTGGVITITRSTPGSLNAVFAATWTGGLGTIAWTFIGYGSDDGTITTTLQGYYLWEVISTLNGITAASVAVYQPLSNAAMNQAPQRILDAVATKIRSMNLPGLSSVNVVQKWLPRLMIGTDAYPTIMVCPGGPENYPGVLNSKDDIGEPVLIAILDNQGALNPNELTANLARNENWRWSIISAFRYNTLPGVPEVVMTHPEPTPKFHADMLEQTGIFFGPIVMRFITRTVRG